MITGTGNVILAIKRLVESAENSIMAMLDSAFGNVNNNIKELKFIIRPDMYTNSDFKNRFENFSLHLGWENIVIRIIPSISLAMSIFDDNKSGLIIFPRRYDYKPDYDTAFEVKDKNGMVFLKKVWDYYWEQAKPP